MEHFQFTPKFDLPLTAFALIGFLINFHLSAKSSDEQSGVDLKERLPTARIRIVLFFAGLLGLCWFGNFAVWAVFALIMVFGLVGSLFAGEYLGPEIVLFGAAAVLREWSFGFPNLILNPPLQTIAPADATVHEYIGQHGVTTSPLRPSGDIQINGKEVSAVSENGLLIETGTEVIVTAYRNGRASVACVNGG